ncbi:MAG: ERF family protein [Chitinophagaceae bacterium]|nr:ERF family protein [Chitinophagaceae bacterium]
MQTSESIKQISVALLGFHKEVPTISKESKNPFFKSSYADLPTILKAINPVLQRNGLVVLQFPEGESGLTTRLLHSSGEWMESTYTMKPVKATPQDAGSAITYQRRYAIGAILNLDIDNDDDGNSASGKGEKQPANNTSNMSELPWLNEGSEEFKKAVTYLKEGKKISAIEAKFRISKKVREILLTNAA